MILAIYIRHIGGRGRLLSTILFSLEGNRIQYLQKCINFETRIGEKLCNFIILYRPPSHSRDEFVTFLKNFELNFDIILANNLFLAVVLGDFNVTWRTKNRLYILSILTQYKKDLKHARHTKDIVWHWYWYLSLHKILLSKSQRIQSYLGLKKYCFTWQKHAFIWKMSWTHKN